MMHWLYKNSILLFLFVNGGTRVKELSEIGTIELIKTVNKGKDNRRMYFALKNIK